MLRNLFEWYLDHQKELVEKYDGKYLVIRNNAVVGVHDSDSETVFDAESRYEAGTFLVQKCSHGGQDSAQCFNSPCVTFA
ncbi:MAG: hypothetical protein MdMp024_0435 [Bacteroidales bacterium]